MKLIPKIAVLLGYVLATVLVLSGCGGGTVSGTIPTATISSAAGSSGTVIFTFAFNESVGTTFNAGEVTVTGGTAASSVTSIGNNSYTLVVTPTTGASSVVVTLPINKVTDINGNSNSAVATNTYTISNAAPNITIVGANTAPVSGENLNPNWGQATVETTAAGNVMNMTSFNYQGIDLSANPVNATGMTYLHIDFTSNGVSTLGVALVTNLGLANQAESPYSITSISSSANHVDIPLTAYSGGTPAANLASIGQIKLTNGPDGSTPVSGGTVSITNMYFSATATSGSNSGTSGTTSGTTATNSGGTTGTLNFMTGFKTASTVEGGVYGGTSGSSLDGYTCPGNSATATTSCGSGGSFTDGSPAAMSAATSSFYAYYQFKGTAPTGEYAGIYVFAPGVSGLSTTTDTAGMTLNGQTNIAFNLGINPEFFSNADHNVAVIINLGKLYPAGGGCHLQLQTVFTPTSAATTNYTLPLSNFAVAQDCATGTPPSGYAAALTSSPAISEVVFQAASGAAALKPNLTGGLTSGANTTIANGSYFPTTITLTGGIAFQ